MPGSYAGLPHGWAAVGAGRPRRRRPDHRPAEYKVASSVTTHEAWGLGSYRSFTTDPTITAYHGFEAPLVSTVKFHDLLTVSLGGKGNIAHIINDTGAVTPAGTAGSKLVTYP